MKPSKKYILLTILSVMCVINSGCRSRQTFESLSDSGDTQSSSEEMQKDLIVGMNLFTYHTQKVYDSYSDSKKDVQISNSYPLVLSQEKHDITYKAQVNEQYFEDSNSRLTFFALENGQLCNLIYDGKSHIALSENYYVGEQIIFDYTLELENKEEPVMLITACTDQNLPQTENEWIQWSEKCNYINAEVLPVSDVSKIDTHPQRLNSTSESLNVQNIQTNHIYESVILMLSDECDDSLEFTQNWNVSVSSDNDLYLYCLTPFDNCSLFLLIDDVPTAVFDKAYGADIESGNQSTFKRFTVSIPTLSEGIHYAYPLLIDRNTSQVYKGMPILLTAGESK